MALGPVILGHADPGVNEAIARQLRDGITFTLPHPIEVEVAERVVELVPGAERVRFGKTGSDVTSAADAARASLHRARRRARVRLPRLARLVHRIDVARRRRAGGRARPDRARSRSTTSTSLDAALEARPGRGRRRDPRAVRRATSRRPAFSRASSSVTRAAGAVVDLRRDHHRLPARARRRAGALRRPAPTSRRFGKALGNGMPISALAGRAELMDRLEDVFFSGTHGGEALSLAAAQRRSRPARRSRPTSTLYAKGERLRAGVQRGDRARRARGVGEDRRRRAADRRARSASPRLGRRPAGEDARPAGAPQARRPLQRLELHLPRALRRGHRPADRRLPARRSRCSPTACAAICSSCSRASPSQPAFRPVA